MLTLTATIQNFETLLLKIAYRLDVCKKNSNIESVFFSEKKEKQIECFSP